GRVVGEGCGKGAGPVSKKAIALCTAVGVFFILAFVSAGLTADPPTAGAALQKYTPSPEDLRAGYERTGPPAGRGRLYKAQGPPHWFEHNTRFWYRNDLRGGQKEFILVDAERGKREAAFDHAKLAAALSKAAGTDYNADRLPFDAIDFVDEGKAIQFKVDKT